MKNFCEKALFQINEKMYAKEFEDDYDHIFCYGISFFQEALHGWDKVRQRFFNGFSKEINLT